MKFTMNVRMEVEYHKYWDQLISEILSRSWQGTEIQKIGDK